MHRLIARLGVPALIALTFVLTAGTSARAQVKPEEVTIEAPDGLQMAGTYFAGQPGKPGLILLHMISRTREDWRRFALDAQLKGYHVLTLDNRGHGESNTMKDGTKIDWRGLTNPEYQLMPTDLVAAVKWLRTKKVAQERIGIIGASIGANAALVASTLKGTNIRTLVLLSPGTNYKGIETLAAAEAYGKPVLIAVGDNDRNAFISTKKLEKAMGENATVKIYEGPDHGNFLFSANPDLEPLVVKWLVDHLDS